MSSKRRSSRSITRLPDSILPADSSLGCSRSGPTRRFVDLLAGEDVLPDEDLELDEKRQLVKALMETMPAKLAEVLILAYYHRFPYGEIAEIVGIPLGTVKSRLHAAVVHFGQLYRQAVAENAQKSDDS